MWSKMVKANALALLGQDTVYKLLTGNGGKSGGWEANDSASPPDATTCNFITLVCHLPRSVSQAG